MFEPGIVIAFILLLLTALLLLMIYHVFGLKQQVHRSNQQLKEQQQLLDDLNRHHNHTETALIKETESHRYTLKVLQHTQNELDNIIDSMPSILIGINPEGHITHWNQRAEAATGLLENQVIDLPVHRAYPNLHLPLSVLQKAIASGETKSVEAVRDGKGPEARYTDITVYPLQAKKETGAIILIDDVSQRVQLESMMIQNEKMLSLGELAAGLAHEINNPLGAIIQGAQNIQRRTNNQLSANHADAQACGIELAQVQAFLERRKIPRFLNSIQQAGERAAKIVANMLEFSRVNHRDYAPTDISELVEDSIELASTTLKLPQPFAFKQIHIVRDFDETLPQVVCSAAEIQQVLLNLLRNAAQAIAETAQHREPTIRVSLRSLPQSITIELADSGPGMDEAIQRHIFEPFFTTKEVGAGTGLGLSVSYFIITEHHGGTIEVDSKEGQGTRFVIKLPIEPHDFKVIE